MRQMTTTRWVLLFLIAATIFATPRTWAGDDYDGRDYYRRHHHHHRSAGDYCVTDFWGSCLRVARHRHAYRWRYYHHRSYRTRFIIPGAGERIDHGLFCHARRRVIGEEQAGKKKALDNAQKAWMNAVRYDHGERYQDINHAKDVRQTCDFSSHIRPGIAEKLFKRDFFRCVVEATPCRAPPSAIEENVERRYESEDD